jgi:hypothetical protein
VNAAGPAARLGTVLQAFSGLVGLDVSARGARKGRLRLKYCAMQESEYLSIYMKFMTKLV